MGTTYLKLVFNFILSLWPWVFIITCGIVVLLAVQKHCDNKLAGGGYMWQHFNTFKDDTEIRAMVIDNLKKQAEVLESMKKAADKGGVKCT